MSPTRKHNLKIAAVVILIRMPLLLPFYILMTVGQAAEWIGECIADTLPGFLREK